MFREAFGLPEEEMPLGEVHAVLSLQGKTEAYVSEGCCVVGECFISAAHTVRSVPDPHPADISLA